MTGGKAGYDAEILLSLFIGTKEKPLCKNLISLMLAIARMDLAQNWKTLISACVLWYRNYGK